MLLLCAFSNLFNLHVRCSLCLHRVKQLMLSILPEPDSPVNKVVKGRESKFVNRRLMHLAELLLVIRLNNLICMNT